MNIKPDKGNTTLNIVFAVFLTVTSIKTMYQILEQHERRKIRKQCNCEKL